MNDETRDNYLLYDGGVYFSNAWLFTGRPVHRLRLVSKPYLAALCFASCRRSDMLEARKSIFFLDVSTLARNCGSVEVTPAQIKAARKELGLSINECAELHDCDGRTWRRFEDETGSTRRDPAYRVVRLLKCYLLIARELPHEWEKIVSEL